MDFNTTKIKNEKTISRPGGIPDYISYLTLALLVVNPDFTTIQGFE